MGGLDVVVLIVKRSAEETYLSFLEKKEIKTVLSFPCNGTATDKILSGLGLERTEKICIFCVLERKRAEKLLEACKLLLGLAIPGNGIAFIVPLESIGGKSSLDTLTYGQKINMEEVKSVEKSEYPFRLILAITESGSTEMVMDAAYSGGARGGTVIHAKGTAGEMTRKFLGISLADEKEIILILASKDGKNSIMKAIMDKAGIRSNAHTVLFSLPVDEVEGISLFEQKEEEEFSKEDAQETESEVQNPENLPEEPGSEPEAAPSEPESDFENRD